MSFCADCFKGVRHEGTPKGKIETLDGVTVYVATPSTDYPKDKVVLFLPDAMGLQAVNSQLLADDFAENGFKTVIVDYYAGDPVPEGAFDLMRAGKYDWQAWMGRHSQQDVMALTEKVIAALKAQDVTTFGATGYCYGGYVCMQLAHANVAKAVVMSHPTFLQVPVDFEKLKTQSQTPVFINSCEFDEPFPPEKAKIADELLGSGKYAPGYERAHFPGCNHGFAVRGDLSKPEVKAGKEGAFKNAVEFFHKHL